MTLLSVWKNALELFVFNKSAMNSNHEFALVVLTDQANWVRMAGIRGGNNGGGGDN